MVQSETRTSKNLEGIVFDIKNYAIHDGPGIRTTVFFKGCYLKCLWCANPESQNIEPDIYFDPTKCIMCMKCAEICPEDAIQNDASIIRYKCTKCGNCAQVCYTEAKRKAGKVMTVDQVIKEITKDQIFYGDSGGMTLSGGEPLFQKKFAIEILKKCKERGISTALDTCGHTVYYDLKLVLEYIDLVLYDLKTVDTEKHISFTGVSNKVILENLSKIDNLNIPIWIRIPIVPGFTDSENNINKIAEFISKLQNIEKVCLMPYHNLGIRKYELLDRRYTLSGIKPCETNKLKALKNILERTGFDINIGG